MATGDNDNNVDGDSATGSEVDDDGDGVTGDEGGPHVRFPPVFSESKKTKG